MSIRYIFTVNDGLLHLYDTVTGLTVPDFAEVIQTLNRTREECEKLKGALEDKKTTWTNTRIANLERDRKEADARIKELEASHNKALQEIADRGKAAEQGTIDLKLMTIKRDKALEDWNVLFARAATVDAALQEWRSGTRRLSSVDGRTELVKRPGTNTWSGSSVTADFVETDGGKPARPTLVSPFKFDPRLPCRTRDGRPARVVSVNAVDAQQPIIAIIPSVCGIPPRDAVEYFNGDGTFMRSRTPHVNDLCNTDGDRSPS